jgi:WS/DGAT/MGAT family acyltransferase
MVISTVLLFDEPVDWDRAKRIIRRRLVDRHPRLRQHMVQSSIPLRASSWEWDPDFTLEHHVHHVALPAPGGPEELAELVGDLMAMPLDRDRPLWQMHLVDGVGDGAALIGRMHHCIADGVSLAGIMLSLTDPERVVGIAPPVDHREFATPRSLPASLAIAGARTVARAGSAGVSVLRQGTHIAASPLHAGRLAGAITRDSGTALRLLLATADGATVRNGDPGTSRRVAWTSGLSLQRVKRIASAHDATVDDVLLAAVSGGLRHYLRARGRPVVDIDAIVQYNLMSLDGPVPSTLGNKFGPVSLRLPVGASGSYRRLVDVHRRMDESKRPIEAAVLVGPLNDARPVLRWIADLFSAKRTAVMTIARGPREPVYFAGSRLGTALVWVPASGHEALSVSIFSYRDEVTVGLIVDEALVADPDEIVTELEQELDALSRLGPVATRGRARAGTHVRARA